MKRALSIWFIMLANVLILAHAVIPHHHHNKVLVAIVNVLDEVPLDNHSHGHGHHHGEATHQHAEGEDCLVSEAVAAATLRFQTDQSTHQVNPTQPLPDSGHYLLLCAIVCYFDPSLNLFNVNKVRKKWPYLPHGHAQYVARASGLRAPPVC